MVGNGDLGKYWFGITNLNELLMDLYQYVSTMESLSSMKLLDCQEVVDLFDHISCGSI